MNNVVGQFLRGLRGSSGVGLVYYSGHGLQVGGENYLVPVDAQIHTQWDDKNETLSVSDILAGMGERGDQTVNLLILDACRNNPYESSKGIGGKGLARLSRPTSSLILYAAQPGMVADDNPQGRNGLFTKHLLQAIDKQGVEVEDAFKDVVAGVYQESYRAQHPWKEGAPLQRFYFHPRQHQPAPPAVNMELEFWRSSERCDTQSCYQAYLEAYPKGRFAPLALARLDQSQFPAAPS